MVFDLYIIAVVVIDCASLFWMKGNMIGTSFGVLTIGALRNGLNLLNVSPFWVQFLQGAVFSSPSCLTRSVKNRDVSLRQENPPGLAGKFRCFSGQKSLREFVLTHPN
jgi:hypothetical protein